MSNHEALFSLLVIAFVIVAGPAIGVRLRIPAPVVLILLGVLVGPGGVGLVQPSPPVDFVSDFGFLVLMFVAGMEIDFVSIRKAGKRALIFPLLTVLGVFASGIALGRLLGFDIIDVLVLSAMSVGMPIAVLQDSGKLQTAMGRYVLLTVSIGEFLSIVVFIIFEVFSASGSTFDRIARMSKMVALFVVCALLIRWARAFVWWHPEPFKRLVRHHDVAELGVRTGIFLMFGFVVLSALLGVEAILGAFIAGALVGFVLVDKSTLEGKIAALGQGLFIPAFFVVVGVRFDPGLLDAQILGLAATIVACAGLVKILPSLVFAPPELGLKDRIAAGSLVAAPLTLVVAIGAIGEELGIVPPSLGTGFVLVAVALSVLFPIVFRVLAGPPVDDGLAEAHLAAPTTAAASLRPDARR